MGNSKKRAIEIVKNTEIYKYIYEQDAKEIKNTFDKAQYDYILATNKAANGEIGLEEFRQEQLEFEVAQANYNNVLQEYNSDEYAESIIKNYCAKSDLCAIEYKKSENLEKIFGVSVFSAGFGAIMGTFCVAVDESNERHGVYDRQY